MELRWQRLEGRSGHEAGRALLAEMAGEGPILYTPRGKPCFENGPHFSISHTKNHVFCCVSDHNVAVDAEEADRPIDLRLADKVLSPGERARFDAVPDKQAALLKLWVLKECFAKLTGRGWGNYLYRTDFDPNDSRIIRIDGCYVAVMEDKEEHYAV